MKKLLIVLSLLFNLKADLINMLPGLSQVKEGGKLFVVAGTVEEKKQQLTELEKERAALESNNELSDALQSQSDKISKEISSLTERLNKEKDLAEQAFIRDLLTTANEISQILTDSQLIRKKIISLMDHQIELLSEYLKEPNFKSLKVDPKSTYKFEALEAVSSQISTQEENKQRFIEDRTNLEIDLDNKKKTLVDVEKELKAKIKEQKEFLDNSSTSEGDFRKNAESLDFKLQILKAKKDFLDLKIAELTNNLSLLNINIHLVDKKLTLLKEDLDTIDKSLWVNENDVEEAEKSLAEKKQKYAQEQAQTSKDIKEINQKMERFKERFKELATQIQFPIADNPQLSDWSFDLSKYEDLPNVFDLGHLNDQVLRQELEINLKEAQRDLEKIKLASDEILTSIVKSWYKISQRKVKTEDDITAERTIYVSYKNEAVREMNGFKDKAAAASSELNKLARIVNNIREKIVALEKKLEEFNKKYGKEVVKKSLSQLKKSENLISKQIDITNKLIEAYTAIKTTISDTLKQTRVIVSKLDGIGGLLQRSEHAISWSNLKNIIPDLKEFAKDLKNMVYSFFTKNKMQIYGQKIISILTNVGSLFKLILWLLFILGIFFFLQALLPAFELTLKNARVAGAGASFPLAFLVMLLGFLSTRLGSFYFWLIGFLLIKFSVFTDLGLLVAFYIFSIPYLFAFIRSFISYFTEFNKKNKYLLLNKDFEDRFTTVLNLFLYSTVAIFFFRDAFMVLTYSRSELPTFLLALYSVIFRALLIFLIGRDELLSVIPKEKFWEWLRRFVSAYYYPILIAIVALMVISDPYIGGFSKLVSFFIWGGVWSTVLIAVLWWGQIFVRKYSEFIFFSSEGELDGAKERFPYSKTLYGLFMVAAFLFSIFIGITLAAKIWGYSFGLGKFEEVLGFSFIIDGKAVTILALLKLFGFIFLGFVFAWAVNRFILQNIFDILLVDVGVQNTVSSITRYVIVVAVFLVGLMQVSLGGMIPVIVGAIALGLAFAVKGPVNDFVAYFIILVERPLKLGDFVEINKDVMGVVRKITARSVILRRKNSVSIVVPNSMVTNNSFYNWNYVQGFFAFPDILLNVPYSSNIEVVKDVLWAVVESNPNILKSPRPIIRLDDFVENGYQFRVRGFLSSVNVINQWQIASDVRFSIVKALKEKGITIASPVRQIFINQDSAK